MTTTAHNTGGQEAAHHPPMACVFPYWACHYLNTSSSKPGEMTNQKKNNPYLCISGESHKPATGAMSSSRKAFCRSQSLNWLLMRTRASIRAHFSICVRSSSFDSSCFTWLYNISKFGQKTHQVEKHHAFGIEEGHWGRQRRGVLYSWRSMSVTFSQHSHLLLTLKILCMFSLRELLFFPTPLSLSCIHFPLTLQND